MKVTDKESFFKQCTVCLNAENCQIKRQAQLLCDNPFIVNNFCTKQKRKITNFDKNMLIKFDE